MARNLWQSAAIAAYYIGKRGGMTRLELAKVTGLRGDEVKNLIYRLGKVLLLYDDSPEDDNGQVVYRSLKE